MKNGLILYFVLFAVGCAGPRQGWMQNGVPKTTDEYVQAHADCEREVGGRNYLTALGLCMKERGWHHGRYP